jgi:hypothetical protein
MTTAKHARLSAAWSLFAENPILLVIAGIGFFVSFQTIAHEAHQQHMPGWPVLYPLLIDAGIVGFSIEARKAIDDQHGDLVPRVMAWLLSGFTVYVNAHGAPARDWLGITLHIAAPCLWIAFLELTRWRKLRRRRDESHDRIPLRRYLADNPKRTLGMRRRMILHNINSYPVAVAREEARLLAIDLVRDVRGRRWKRSAPTLLVHHLKAGTLPASVATSCSMASAAHQPVVAELVEQWVTDALSASAKAKAKVKAQQRVIEESANASDDASVAVPDAPQKTRAATRRPRVSPREQKRLKVESLLKENPDMLRKDIARSAGVSESTVDRIKSQGRGLHVVEGLA